MSDDASGLGPLPGPGELHARFARQYPLDWGDPLPTVGQIAAEFGAPAASRSLELLRRAAEHHGEATGQVLAAIPPGGTTYQLDRRVKSPSSLARKLWKYGRKNRPALTDDVLRFTVLASGPEALVGLAVATTDRLAARGWRVESAVHTYVDGSRYKGLHAIMRSTGDHQVEIQFHSPESARVKAATTELYLIERDPRRSKQARQSARRDCIALSATVTQPPGIDQLTELGGVPVRVRNYGTAVRAPQGVGAPQPASEGAGSKHPGRPGIEKDGMTR